MGAVGSRQINMESIFHEKQEGSLCAQHCLNNLLQGEYFSPVELSSIAHQLDEEERMRMAEGGDTSEDYRTFLQQPSGNMDDSGFFSIQVSSHKHVLSVVYIPGTKLSVCFSQPFIVTVLM